MKRLVDEFQCRGLAEFAVRKALHVMVARGELQQQQRRNIVRRSMKRVVVIFYPYTVIVSLLHKPSHWYCAAKFRTSEHAAGNHPGSVSGA